MGRNMYLYHMLTFMLRSLVQIAGEEEGRQRWPKKHASSRPTCERHPKAIARRISMSVHNASTSSRFSAPAFPPSHPLSRPPAIELLSFPFVLSSSSILSLDDDQFDNAPQPPVPHGILSIKPAHQSHPAMDQLLLSSPTRLPTCSNSRPPPPNGGDPPPRLPLPAATPTARNLGRDAEEES